MNYNDMMRNVAGSTGLTRKQADEAVVTTLTVLAETISAEETRDLLAQLPKSIRDRIPVSGTTLEMRPIEFLARVADLTVSATEVDAETSVRAVFSVLTQAVNSGEMNDIAEELGDAYADLLDRTDRVEREEARELAEEATTARIEAAKAILEEPASADAASMAGVPVSSFSEPAGTFDAPASWTGDSVAAEPVFAAHATDSEPSGSVIDLVLSVPAALAHVVVAILRRPVQTGMDLVALVRR